MSPPCTGKFLAGHACEFVLVMIHNYRCCRGNQEQAQTSTYQWKEKKQGVRKAAGAGPEEAVLTIPEEGVILKRDCAVQTWTHPRLMDPGKLGRAKRKNVIARG